MFGRRPDAIRVTNVSTMRRFMPYVSPGRNNSVFYMYQDIEVEAALEFLAKKNETRPKDRPVTIFHLFLRACSHGLYLRPAMKRFVKAGQLWERKDNSITFSAKREMVDGAPLITVKRQFHAERETLDEMVDGIYDQLLAGRSGKQTTSDKEMSLLIRLPHFLVRGLMLLHEVADHFGLLPRAMIDSDPLYTTAFLANLGSIDYPAGHHHLWEYGTCSLFGVMGRIEPGANGRRKMQVAWTYDERIADGMYSYFTLQGIRERFENPELLELNAIEIEQRDGKAALAR